MEAHIEYFLQQICVLDPARNYRGGGEGDVLYNVSELCVWEFTRTCSKDVHANLIIA